MNLQSIIETAITVALGVAMAGFFPSTAVTGVYLVLLITTLSIVIWFWFFHKPFDARGMIIWILKPTILAISIGLFQSAVTLGWMSSK